MSDIRVRYRLRGQGKFKPVEKLLAAAQANLRERYAHYTRLSDHTPDTAWEKRWYERMCRDLTDTLRLLASPRISLEALSGIVNKVYGGTSDYPPDMERHAQGMRLFPEIEFRQEPHPPVKPLVHLPSSTAFCHSAGTYDPGFMKDLPPVPRREETTQPVIGAEPQHGKGKRLTRQAAAIQVHPPLPSTDPLLTRAAPAPMQEKVIPLFTKRPRHKKDP